MATLTFCYQLNLCQISVVQSQHIVSVLNGTMRVQINSDAYCKREKPLRNCKYGSRSVFSRVGGMDCPKENG